MKQPPDSIVGTAVRDQWELRPPVPARDLDEFLEYLGQLEALFGPIEALRVPTAGDRFLL